MEEHRWTVDARTIFLMMDLTHCVLRPNVSWSGGGTAPKPSILLAVDCTKSSNVILFCHVAFSSSEVDAFGSVPWTLVDRTALARLESVCVCVVQYMDLLCIDFRTHSDVLHRLSDS